MIPISKPFIGREEISAVENVLKSGMIAQGPKVHEAEEKFAALCGSKYALAVNSGTAALHSALNAAGIKEGDEVITTPFTFIATANTILMRGAKPVFADIEEDTFNISPGEIEGKITGRTRAIITVDLFGHLCDYEKIRKIADSNSLIIIEDACQAVNAEFRGRKAGSFGDMAAFSFYATKNITCGEGGMMTTGSHEYMENAKLFRQHGRSNMTEYEYTDVGYNYRMTDICAAILLEQFKKLDIITKKRIENAEQLNANLGKVKGIVTPRTRPGHRHVYHQYTIRAGDFRLGRDGLAEHLKREGINTGIYYPKPLHLCKHFRKLGYKEGDFPVSEAASREVLSLPVHPLLSPEDIGKISKTIASLQ